MSAFGETPSERPDAPPWRPPPPGATPRQSHRMRWTLLAIALLAILIAVAPRGAGRSQHLPAGHWGRTIACLERNQLFRLSDAATGALPGPRTTSVVVNRSRGVALAQLRLAGSAAAAVAIAHGGRFPAIDVTGALSASTIAWAYALDGDPPHELADVGERTLIDFCVRTPDRR